jgi:hypothetical protein
LKALKRSRIASLTIAASFLSLIPNLVMISPSSATVSTTVASVYVDAPFVQGSYARHHGGVTEDFNGLANGSITSTSHSIVGGTKTSGQFTVFGKDLYENIDRTEEGIRTITLDSLSDEAKVGDNILVKIDTEGSDLDVILGGKEFIQKFKGYEDAEIEWDISELPEMQTDMETMSKWVNSVPLTLNERREVFNYEEIDDEMMNEIYIPTGIVNLNDPTLNTLMDGQTTI